jgi:hypothetical protein
MTGPIGCPDCGEPIARQCAGHITRARSGREPGHRCHHPALRGATVCGSHGGAAPQVQRAAARRLADAEVMAAAVQFSVNGRSPVDVLAELERLTAVTTAFMEFATARVEALSPGEWAAFGPRTAAEVDVFRSALAEARRLLTELARLGLVERQLAQQRETMEREVREKMGTMIYLATESLYREHGLPVDDPQLREDIARHIQGAAARIRGDD